jgi:hydrogenase/urease accessory protein HupE
VPPNFFFWADIFSPVSGRHIILGPTYFRDHMILGGFQHMVFVEFPVKELLIQVIGLGFWMPLAPICILYCKQCNTIV